MTWPRCSTECLLAESTIGVKFDVINGDQPIVKRPCSH